MTVQHRFDDDAPQSSDRAGDPTGRDRGFGPRWRRPFEDPWATVRREVDRSRRHTRPLSLLRLPMPRNGRHDRQALMTMAGALSGALRGVDSVWVDHEGIFVLLPESDRAAAEGLLARLPAITSAAASAAATIRVSLACFPEDGLTTNALRAAVGHDEAPSRAPTNRSALRASRAQLPSKEAAR